MVGRSSLLFLALLAACAPDDKLYKQQDPVPDPPEGVFVPVPSAAEVEPEPVVVTPPAEVRPEVPEVECEGAEMPVPVRPLDLVLIVDNSCSMAEEILEVQENINDSLAQVIQETGIDYRVILLSRHGEATTSADAEVRSICVSAPLSGTTCQPVPEAPAVTDRFFQYSVEIGSRDAWCQLLMTLDGRIEEQYGLAPDGWLGQLREDSIKSFIVMTDDGVNCFESQTGWMQDLDAAETGEAIADEFDRALRGRFTSYFEDETERSYVWHSVVGMDEDAPSTGRIVEEPSPTATSAGTGHQALSMLTGGLRFPISRPDRFGELFRTVAEATIETVIDRSCD